MNKEYLPPLHYGIWKIVSKFLLLLLCLGIKIGEYGRDNDLEVNLIKAKQLSNIRAACKDEAMRHTPPVIMTIEQANSYIEDDERVKVLLKSILIKSLRT